MENLRQAIDVVWNQLSVCRWLETLAESPNNTRYTSPIICSETDFVSEDFVRYMVDTYKEVTIDQAGAIAKVMKDVWMKPFNSDFMEERIEKPDPRMAHVLIHLLVNLLEIDNSNEPRCKFEHLLKWREVSQNVGDDMLVCSFLAYMDIQNNRTRTDFAWSPVLRHTNHILNNICDKGLSELHFHLKGSSLNFDIQWLSLMNDIEKRERSCQLLQKHCKSDISFSNILHNEWSLYDLLLIAAYLRWWLFQCCVMRQEIQDPLLNIQSMREILQKPSLKKNDISTAIVVAKVLGRRYPMSPHIDGDVIDYAIPKVLPQNEVSSLRYVNSILHGERLILYSAFGRIYGGNVHDIIYDYISFALLVYTKIKCLFRRELLQINARKGFENFQQYQEDKSRFIKKDSVYEPLQTEMAIKSTCCNQLVNYIECRVAPEKDTRRLLQVLKQFQAFFDKNQRAGYINNEKISERLCGVSAYIIIHFIKLPETKQVMENVWRNFALRNDVRKQSEIIKSAYIQHSSIRKLICGFDAANAERDARPEVFAQAFRYLRNELRYPQDVLIEEQPHTIGLTYHVGEDFWDVVDGLRAVDEALLFLGLQGGDRIGHAMVLGISADEYYKTRHHYVTMPKQVFLDNLVWLQHKLQSYNISIPSELTNYIIEKVDMYAADIYQGCTTTGWSLQQLYYAWMLRGDNPKTLQMGNRPVDGEWGKYAYTISNDLLISKELYYARQNSEIINIAFLYHMNAKRGDEMCVEKLPTCIIKVLEELQCKMRKNIEYRKIAIETNLSSNLKIGEFERFDKHPILKFNRDGLDDKCDTSILVSINTDDQGIFATSITNEYALMASAIEKIRDKNGELIFRPSQVMNWLDCIRESSIAQRFVK